MDSLSNSSFKCKIIRCCTVVNDTALNKIIEGHPSNKIGTKIKGL